MTILVHGQSSVVLHVLENAARRGIRFNVIITESGEPTYTQQIKKRLEDAHIPTKLIKDAAIAIAI